MKLLISIDPGTKSAGVAFFDLTDKIKFIESCCIKDATGGKIGAVLDGFFANNECDTVTDVYIVVEDQFLAINADTMKKIARNSGIFIGALDLYFEFTSKSKTFEFVAPKKWQNAMLALNGRPKRAEIIKAYRLKAATLLNKSKIQADEAAAICIGFWYAGELRLKGIK